MRCTPLPSRTRHRSRWIAVLVTLLLTSAQARFEWRDVVQDVSIGADGSVFVRDERTLWTNEDFGEAFICVGHDRGVQLTLLAGSGAVSPGPPATAFQQPCAAGTEVVVRQSPRVTERRVRFNYRLDGTVEPFSDVVQWYWNLVQLDHPPIRGYRLTVTAPGPMAAPFDAYVMRYANLEEPRVALSDDRRVLTVAFDRIPTGDGVEIRYLMDPTLFTLVGGSPGFETLLRDQARISGVQEGDRFWRGVRGHVAWGLLPLAWSLWLAVGVFAAWQRVGREPRTDGMRYPFEPPSDLPPAAVTAMMPQSFSASIMGPGWFATIMDLARRGFARFEGDGRTMKVVLDPTLDRSSLETFERQVLDYLGSAAAAGQRRGGTADEVTMGQLEAYGRTHAQAFLSRWGPLVRKWVEGFLGGPLVTEESRVVSGRWAGRAALALLASAALSFISIDTARGLFVAAAVVAGVLALVSLMALPAWRPEVAKERAGWVGFRRTLTDYTRMKDAPPDFFMVWDRYYAYAAALGVAARFLQTLQRAAPARGIDQSQMLRQARWMGSANANSLKGMATAVNALSSSLAKAGASASSGGSSSGGGGGGGGGGSSGGR